MKEKQSVQPRRQESSTESESKWLARLMATAIVCITITFAMHVATQVILVVQIIG